MAEAKLSPNDVAERMQQIRKKIDELNRKAMDVLARCSHEGKLRSYIEYDDLGWDHHFRKCSSCGGIWKRRPDKS